VPRRPRGGARGGRPLSGRCPTRGDAESRAAPASGLLT
jgi:hypothetical protein